MRIAHLLTGIFTLAATSNLASATHPPPPQYLLYDLGTLGGNQSFGTGINSVGQITGLSSLTGDIDSTTQRPFLYSNGVMQAIGTLSGSYGSDINDAGMVAGGGTFSPGVDHAFLFANGIIKDLGTFGGAYSQGQRINNSGQVTGKAALLGDATEHAFRYSAGNMKDLGTLGGSHSAGFGINNSGQVTGDASISNGLNHAFLYSGNIMHDLGTLGGLDSHGDAINDAGQVAGWSQTFIGGPTHAFLYSGGVMQDIDTRGGEVSYSYGINALGEVVGSSYLTVEVNTFADAFLFSGGTMYDLNDLVINMASADFSQLTLGADINDNGWIVGSGITTSGATHAFLAKPVPEPATAGLLGLGVLALGARCRKRVPKS